VRIYDEVLDATAIAALAAGLPALPGDNNGDGKVDAADYVVWRKNPGNFAPDAYATWRANFGNPPGSGSGLGNGAGSVPEPATVAFMAIAILSACVPRRRR
jgi:hypothetical protein